jgi:hypothetical protein
VLTVSVTLHGGWARTLVPFASRAFCFSWDGSHACVRAVMCFCAAIPCFFRVILRYQDRAYASVLSVV